MKIPMSFRLSPEAVRLIKRLSDEMGISQAAVLEIATREMFKNIRETPDEQRS